MSSIWPFLLILLYFVTLILSLFRHKELVREEIKFAAWYFVIGMMAGAQAHFHYLDQLYGDPGDINPYGLFRKTWEVFLFPYIETYVVLCSSRYLFLLIKEWLKRRRKKDLPPTE